jgi:acyl dehydratase
MAMHIDRVMNFAFPVVRHDYSARDTILYALGIGYGDNPESASELTYLYEKNLKAVPSQCVVLGYPGFWAKTPELDINWVKLLHGEQSFEIHKEIPPEGSLTGEFEIEAIDDKGPQKGAILHLIKRLHEVESRDLVATVRTVLFLRGDGGCGSVGVPKQRPPGPIAATSPDAIYRTRTLPQQALLYRLSGDLNPIHADPAVARQAGFERPILHGLCTMGIATKAVLETFLPGEADRLKSLYVRFSKPAFPGETVTTELFNEGNEIRFRCRVDERDIIVIDQGRAVICN